MGFVNLPIEGNPGTRLPQVLDQIQAALAEDPTRIVRRIGNRIEFSTNSFAKRWLFTGRFRIVSSGEIEAEASTDSLMIDYRLSFFEVFVVLIAMTPMYMLAMISRGGIASLRIGLPWLLLAVVVCFGGGMTRSVFEFSRFLRQFR